MNMACCIKSPFSEQNKSFIFCSKMVNSVFIFHALKQTGCFFYYLHFVPHAMLMNGLKPNKAISGSMIHQYLLQTISYITIDLDGILN